ncbi:Acyltransferase LovD [Vanrija pseudolonga]|uniref:Acyltransferase LovD n=1 Tax=Vanrija pseudolonga TaxID=143232 RepID=A0AAF0YFI4_9TREE|nr:Acyltransferase LovD [Vanrija pseudolonga]
MPTPTLSAAAKAKLDALLHTSVAQPETPAFAFAAATADELLYFNSAGERVWGSPDKGQVDDTTLYQLYSMTKLVTAVAALQLVDEGKLEIDDGAIIEQTLPELAARPILSYDADGKEVLTARKNPITLRRLLSHTSGLGYTLFDPRYVRWMKDHGKPQTLFMSAGGGLGALEIPLLFEPGTSFVYGVGIDWAGVLVERLSGLSLEEYFQQRIFKPLGIKSLTFHLTQEYIDGLQAVTDRNAEGKLHLAPSLREVVPHTMKQFHGGDGLYGTAKDYVRFLQGVLASAKPGGLVSPESYKWLFTNVLPEREGTTVYEGLTGFLSLLPVDKTLLADTGKALGYSLSLQLNTVESAYGRKAGSASWGGAAKTMYWIDPVTGVIGAVFTQVLNGNPLASTDYVNNVYYNFERELYNVLE